MEKIYINSAQEWIDLPEPELPELQSEDEKGAVYTLAKLGFYTASKEECETLGIKADQPHGMTYALPIAMMKLDKELELCRLPIAFTSWAFRALVVTQRGADPFPAEVEVGIVDGQAFISLL